MAILSYWRKGRRKAYIRNATLSRPIFSKHYFPGFAAVVDYNHTINCAVQYDHISLNAVEKFMLDYG